MFASNFTKGIIGSSGSYQCPHLKKVSQTDEFVDRVDAEWLIYMVSKDINAITSDSSSDICVCIYPFI